MFGRSPEVKQRFGSSTKVLGVQQRFGGCNRDLGDCPRSNRGVGVRQRFGGCTNGLDDAREDWEIARGQTKVWEYDKG